MSTALLMATNEAGGANTVWDTSWQTEVIYSDSDRTATGDGTDAQKYIRSNTSKLSGRFYVEFEITTKPTTSAGWWGVQDSTVVDGDGVEAGQKGAIILETGRLKYNGNTGAFVGGIVAAQDYIYGIDVDFDAGTFAARVHNGSSWSAYTTAYAMGGTAPYHLMGHLQDSGALTIRAKPADLFGSPPAGVPAWDA